MWAAHGGANGVTNENAKWRPYRIVRRVKGRGLSICPLTRCRRWAINYGMLRWRGSRIHQEGSGIREPNRVCERVRGWATEPRGQYELASRQRRDSHVCNCIKCANIFPFSRCRFLFNLTILFDLPAAFLHLFRLIRYFFASAPPLRHQQFCDLEIGGAAYWSLSMATRVNKNLAADLLIDGISLLLHWRATRFHPWKSHPTPIVSAIYTLHWAREKQA